VVLYVSSFSEDQLAEAALFEHTCVVNMNASSIVASGLSFDEVE
jgi:hypothetical protein